MKQRTGKTERIKNMVQSCMETVSNQPLLEIAGQKRILIEHHRGIAQYDSNCVSVCVAFGYYHIRGCGLTVAKMSGEQLVIFGSIESICLERRK